MVQALQLSLYSYVNSFVDVKFGMTLKKMLLKISLKYKHYFSVQDYEWSGVYIGLRN